MEEKKPFLFKPIGNRFHRVAHKLKIRFWQEIKNHGYSVTPDQIILLTRLWEEEGLSQNEICKLTSKGKSNVTRIIDNLMKKGLVIRKTDPKDRRSTKVYLTEEGKALRDSMLPIITRYFNEAFAGFNEKEFEMFEGFLSRITENLDNL